MMLPSILLSTSVFGTPWHKVNEFDLDGNVCPAILRPTICPPVCVRTLSDCPVGLRPDTCEPGTFYCGDGRCHTGPSQEFACKFVPDICACPDNTATNGFIPCKSLKIQAQNLVHSAENVLIDQCQRALNQTSPTAIVRQCKPRDPILFSFMNGEFVMFYLFALVETALLLCYLRYKQHVREKITYTVGVKNKDEYRHVPVIEQGIPSPTIKFKGYKQDAFGTFVKYSIIGSSIGWIVVFAILIGDYYEMFAAWAGKNDKLLFYNHDNLSRVFIVFWHFTLLWFLGLHAKRSSMKTLFLSPTDIPNAQYVLIENTRSTAVQSGDMGKLVEFAQRLEAWLRNYTKTNISREIKTLKTTKLGRIYVEYECVRYIYNEKTNSFEPFRFDIASINSKLLEMKKGLTEIEATERIELTGPNQILFEKNSFWEGIKLEFSGMFYLYQLMMLLIWYFYAYYYMGLVLTAIIIGSGLVKVLVSNASQQRVLEMATFRGYAKVFRNNRWTEIPSSNLVVGDVMEIEVTSEPLSVDCAIISGDVVVDESTLTGEALPVRKVAVKNDDNEFSKEMNAKLNCLFAGTTVLETQHAESNEKITAVVLATGGSTEKGKLVRDILYPVPFIFVFTEHLKIVVPVLIIWGFLLLLVSIVLNKGSDAGSWFYGMFGISQVLSPVLPAVLVIGQSVSSERLRAKGIMCVDLNRITLAGKVKVFCFDKTGTLTKEGLEFGGVHEVSHGSFMEKSTTFQKFSYHMKLGMQSCHSLAMAQNQCVGNFVDVELFSATGASIDRNTNSVIHPVEGRPIKILRRFEFIHAHAYMSTVCQDSSGSCFVFLKGSYEKIINMVNKDSIPANFVDVAKQHAADGYYVLALAGREISTALGTDSKITREEYEQNLSLFGLILFRNEIKPDTSSALAHLRQGGVRTVMITGDHANTALFIGKQAGMITVDEWGSNPEILLAEMQENELIWINTETKRQLTQEQVEQAIYRSRQGGDPVELVIVGKAFNYLLEYYWLPQFIGECRIFARMSPLDKAKCVRLHMANHITAMCGDGGNDAGALKAAHAGIALSGNGSSVVSHFSSADVSINSCVELLREARCSLDVSFASYKMLILYGEILAFSGLVQYYFTVQMSQALWVFVDGCTVPVSWALTMAKPAKVLSSFRPTARLLGFETILSVLGPIFINMGFLAVLNASLFHQGFFRCNEFDGTFADLRKWWELGDNYEGAIIGVITAFQILHTSCALNIGTRYREGFMKNKLYLLVYFFMVFILSLILVLDPNPIGCHFRINCGTKDALESLGYNVNWFNPPAKYFSATGHNVIPLYFRIAILGFSFANLAALMCWEGIAILGPVRNWAKSFANGRWQVKKQPLRV